MGRSSMVCCVKPMNYWRNATVILYIGILSLYLFFTAFSLANVVEDSYANVCIYIDSHGVTHVDLTVKPNVTGMIGISLPLPPIIITIDAFVDGKNVPVVMCGDMENTICIPIEENSTIVKLSYIANVSLAQGVFEVGIKPPANVTLTISPNIILLGIPSTITREPIVIDGNLTIAFTVIEFYTLRYIVREAVTTRTTVIGVAGTLLGNPLAIISIAITSTAFIVLLYLFTRRGHKLKKVAMELGDVDMMIVKSLEKRGGSALQSELQKDIPIPKTTLWRHIKKLEKLGIVRIEKLGTQNRIILTKKR